MAGIAGAIRQNPIMVGAGYSSLGGVAKASAEAKEMRFCVAMNDPRCSEEWIAEGSQN
jgi:hypothetical protein